MTKFQARVYNAANEAKVVLLMWRSKGKLLTENLTFSKEEKSKTVTLKDDQEYIISFNQHRTDKVRVFEDHLFSVGQCKVVLTGRNN